MIIFCLSRIAFIYINDILFGTRNRRSLHGNSNYSLLKCMLKFSIIELYYFTRRGCILKRGFLFFLLLICMLSAFPGCSVADNDLAHKDDFYNNSDYESNNHSQPHTDFTELPTSSPILSSVLLPSLALPTPPPATSQVTLPVTSPATVPATVPVTVPATPEASSPTTPPAVPPTFAPTPSSTPVPTSSVEASTPPGTNSPSSGTWQIKKTTGKKYIILGTDDDNVGNPKFFRLLRTYGFPYTMNTEAENVIIRKALGTDSDETIFTSDDAPALFPDGVDIITLGKYIQKNSLGEVAQHGASTSALWDSEKLTGDFLASLHATYTEQGGTKSKEELKVAIMEQLADTDGSQGACYVDASRALLEEAYGFPIYTVGIWGGSPIAIIDGIKCDLNSKKGTSNYDWKFQNYTAVGSLLGSLKSNASTYDLPRISCDIDSVYSYIDMIEPDKVCEFFWHMPFTDEPDIDKWRDLCHHIRNLVDSGKAEVVTRRQYAELGEWVENPITGITITRAHIPFGETDSDEAYTITASYADNSTADVTEEAILDRSAVNTAITGVYTVSASYRGFQATATISVINTDYTIPYGLKDSAYWFIAKNETQNKMIAGNTTGTFGIAGISSNTLVFLDCAAGHFNGWTSTDNGITWTKVNTANQHYKNIKTNTTEGTSCFCLCVIKKQ